MFEKLEFTFLPAYAAYLLDNKFELLVDEQIRLSYELQLPLLEYFKHLGREELKELSKPAMRNYLMHIIENRLDKFIQTSINNWKQNQLPSLTKNQIVTKDISLTILIRKKVFLKYITDYTKDAATIVAIVEEFDAYTSKTELLMFACYTDIQQEEINRQLHLARQNESYYKRAEKLAHIGNWRWDAASDKLEWTDELYRIYEFDLSEEITYEKVAAYNHPEDNGMVQEHIMQSLSSGAPFNFHYRIITDDNREKVLHAVGEVLKENDRKPILLGTLQDVTTQKSVEKLLIENQSFIHKITKLTPSIIAAYNVNTGKYIFINEAIETLLGYDPQQIMDEGVTFFMRLVHPDDLLVMAEKNALALQAANAVAEQPDKEMITEFHYRMKHQDGEYRWFHTFGTVFDRNSDNKVEHILNISLDVTEEYKLRLALEEEYAFADMLIEHSPDILVVLDKELRIVTWNRKAEEHNNLSKEEAIGKGFFELFPQYNYEGWKNNLQRALGGELVYYPKLKFTVDSGYGEIFLIPLRNTEQEISGILCITRIITELVTTTERLQESYKELQRNEERHYRMINEVQDYSIILLDEEGNIESWSAGAEKIKGYTANEVMGKNFGMFYTQADRDAQLPQQLIRQAINEGRATHEGWQMRKDGSVFWANVVVTALHDESGEIVGFSKVAKDLTERKIAEDNLRSYAEQLELKNNELQLSNKKLQDAREQLAKNRTRYLIEAMPHIVATTASDGTLDYANQHLMDYLGLTFEEVQHEKWIDAVHPADKKKLLTIWMKCLETKQDLQMEFRFRRSDGEYLWHLAIAKPIVRAQEELFDMWIITLTNIHDQKLMDEKKDEFIGIASHELKTPLTSAKAYAQMLQMLLKKERNAEALMYVKKTNLFIDRLNNLISELLDITKIQHGKLQMSFAPFNFNEMMADTIELIQHTKPKQRIYSKGTAAYLINGDKERLQQVLTNLLSNAIKYSPEADRVEVAITNCEDHLQVAVRDYGIGIPKSDQQKIFERFYRVEDKATKFQGLGIGLFISAEIIRRHNADIWVESWPGKGSVFYFTLPYVG
ncbi:PAS domain S-box protein [Ilyomonas limi]|uniref:histidine kinase n=1 Tax=Ilyomonas limi TaxID=2575867 RepID=A0A4U3L8V5_9BACT|nr:PAS domain S-box protein [Ilyomonas limi]TKK71708.1 PAS domain S-box protein [Ilyomonas limi]